MRKYSSCDCAGIQPILQKNPSLNAKLARRCSNSKSVSQINNALWNHLKGDLVTKEDILIVKQVKWWNREGRIQHNAKLGWKYERMQCELEVCHEQEKIFPPNYQKSLFFISFKSTPSQSGMVGNHENLPLLSSPTWPLHVMVKISHGSNPDRIL